MNSYSKAFDLTYLGPEGEEVQVLQAISEEEGQVTLCLKTPWCDPVEVITFDLTVPIVTPVPFKGDEGMHGHMVRLPRSKTHRWCHPLLVCPFAEDIAVDRKTGAARFRHANPEDWDFQWITWYGRVHRAAQQAVTNLMSSRQQYSTNFVRMHFRKSISSLITPNTDQNRPTGWQENGTNNCSGLPLTDNTLKYRQIYEVRLGYPDVPTNDQLYEAIKMKFVEFVDGMCDVCYTGKNHTGREVSRVFEGDPISFITQRPMPRLLRGLNPLAQIASPARVWREDRSCAGLLVIKNPVEPPITAKGITLPAEFKVRVTTLVTAIVDIPGFNVFAASEAELAEFPDRIKPGEEISLDGLLITKSGQRKMVATVETAEVRTAEEFLPRLEELSELPGFRFEEDPEEIDRLIDGTSVYGCNYRYWYTRELQCRFDKVKCLCGGIKGVTRPIQQLHTEIDGQVVPIDMVISERTALSKGAKDMMLYPILALAGITEIDPTWTLEELIAMAAAGLKEKGLPETGISPIYATKRVPMYKGAELDNETANCLQDMLKIKLEVKTVRVLVGYGIVGPLPFVRAQETEERQSSSSQGFPLNSHGRVLGGVPLTVEDGTSSSIEKISTFFYDYAPLAQEAMAANL